MAGLNGARFYVNHRQAKAVFAEIAMLEIAKCTKQIVKAPLLERPILFASRLDMKFDSWIYAV